MFYGLWQKAPERIKGETVVHELGHAFGLDHCDEKDKEISVMRQFGFNGVDYPLSDDRAGIIALYGYK